MKELYSRFDELQLKYGAKELQAIYGGGCEQNPDICFVFMNPTGKNVASKKDWTGIRYPWLETKTIWKLFADIGIISSALNHHIQSMKPLVWTPEFCEQVYNEVRNKKAYITNLAKCTQVDARPLPDRVFKEYLDLFSQEMNIIKPKIIILFGNQVSSIVLGKNIRVSEQRKIEHSYNGCKVYSVFYPVGNGRFNLPKAIEDLKWIVDCWKIGC